MSMTQTSTSTRYQIEAHNYTVDMGGKIRCANPEACTTAGHWDEVEIVDTKAEIRNWIGPENDDHPAVRVNRLTITTVSERIEI